jgi:hypothetical protein
MVTVAMAAVVRRKRRREVVIGVELKKEWIPVNHKTLSQRETGR